VDLERLFVRKVGELAQVAIGRDHHVPRRVWKLVQEDERVLAAVHDEPFFIGEPGRSAEDALRLLVSLRDVLQTPGRPELLRHAGERTVCKPKGITFSP
jgi:hypothetical protein